MHGHSITSQPSVAVTLSLLSATVLAIVAPSTALAQSIVPAPDGTGSQVTSEGNDYTITGGTTSSDNQNLFHSFTEFNLLTGESATFLADPAILNILTRINGSDPSIINGLLQVSGSGANLFLINPNGILFGPDAALNLQGSFTATTADRVNFATGAFGTVGTPDYSALVGEPESFSFSLDTPGSVVNAGTLAVPLGESVVLLGGQVLNTGVISSPGGDVVVSAVAGGSLVRIEQTGALLNLEVEALTETPPDALQPFTPLALPELLTGSDVPAITNVTVNPDGTVQLSDGTALTDDVGAVITPGTINVSSFSGGQILLWGESLSLVDGTIDFSGLFFDGNLIVGAEEITASEPLILGNVDNVTDALNAGGDSLSAFIPSLGGGSSGFLLPSPTSGLVVNPDENPVNVPDNSADPTGGAGSFIDILFPPGFGTNLVDVGSEVEKIDDSSSSNTLVSIFGDLTIPGAQVQGGWGSDSFTTTQPISGPAVGIVSVGSVSIDELAVSPNGSNGSEVIGNNRESFNTPTLINQGLPSTRANTALTNRGLPDGRPSADVGEDNEAVIPKLGSNNRLVRATFSNASSTVADYGDLTFTVIPETGDIRVERLGQTLDFEIAPPTDEAGQLRFFTPQMLPELLAAGDRSPRLATTDSSRSPELEPTVKQAHAYLFVGDIHRQRAAYAEAEAHYQQAIELYGQTAKRDHLAIALSSLGVVYQQLGQYETAFETQQSALRVYQAMGDRVGEAAALNNIASTVRRQGDLAQSLRWYKQAREVFVDLDQPGSLANVLNNIGLVYLELNQYEVALDHLRQSLALLETATQTTDAAVSIDLGNTLHNLGFVQQNLENYDVALRYYQQALVQRRASGDRPGEAITLNNLGLLYDEMGQSESAIDLLQQSLDIYRAINAKSGESNALDTLGTIYTSLQRYPEALSAYQQSLALQTQVNNPSVKAIALSNLGKLMHEWQKPELAIVFLKESVLVTETIRGQLQSLPQTVQESYASEVSETYRLLADLLLQQDRVLEAQQVLDLLKVQELDNYLQDVRGGQETLLVLRPEQEILEEYAALQASAVALGQELTQLRQIPVASRSANQESRIAELVALQEDLNAQFNLFIESDVVTALIDQLSSNARRQSLNLEDLSALQDNLAALDAALIYPLLLEDRIELVITTPDSPPLRRTVQGVGRETINAAIAEMRNSIQRREPQVTNQAQQLYDWLIRPLAADLQQADVSTLIYSPDGALRYLPLGVLHDGEQWLVQQYGVTNITARSLAELNTAPASQPRVLAGAFTDTSISYQVEVGNLSQVMRGLPFAGVEIESLRATFPNTRAFIDQDFQLESVRPLMNEYNIIHFATHAAFVPGAPENSFILFGSGERPTLNDIKNWSLQNVDLVVLSACETGIGGFGNGEEILGMGYQFQRAGARAALASLWKVSDGGTQALMTEFYAALQQPGITKAAALRQAQIALITRGEGGLEEELDTDAVAQRDTERSAMPLAATANSRQHPYYWAPFILIGNGL